MNFIKFIAIFALIIDYSFSMEEEEPDKCESFYFSTPFSLEEQHVTVEDFEDNNDWMNKYSEKNAYEGFFKEVGLLKEYDFLEINYEDESKTYFGNATSTNLYTKEHMRINKLGSTKNLLPCLPFLAAYNPGIDDNTIEAALCFENRSIVIQSYNDLEKGTELKLHSLLFGKNAGDLNKNIQNVTATVSHFYDSSFKDYYTLIGNVHVHDGIASPNNFKIKSLDTSNDYNAIKVITKPIPGVLETSHETLIVVTKDPVWSSKDICFKESAESFLNDVIPAFLNSEYNAEHLPNYDQSNYQNNNVPLSHHLNREETPLIQNTFDMRADHYHKGTHRSARGTFDRKQG